VHLNRRIYFVLQNSGFGIRLLLSLLLLLSNPIEPFLLLFFVASHYLSFPLSLNIDYLQSWRLVIISLIDFFRTFFFLIRNEIFSINKLTGLCRLSRF
jgi:hypothetical protein